MGRKIRGSMHALVAAGLLAAGAAQAAVTVDAVASEGYGLGVQVDVGVLGINVLAALLAPPGASGNQLTGYDTSAATVLVNADVGVVGGLVGGLLSLLTGNNAIGLVSSTLNGSASYDVASGVVQGRGAVEDLDVNVLGILGLESSVLATTSSITIDQANNALIAGSSFATFADLDLEVLGLDIDLDALVNAGPNTTLLSIGNILDLTLNERLVNGSRSIADCSGLLACSVETNAIRLTLDLDALPVLGALALDGGVDVKVGHSFASAAVTPIIPAIPEPSTYALMLGGLAAVAALARRRQTLPAPAAAA